MNIRATIKPIITSDSTMGLFELVLKNKRIGKLQNQRMKTRWVFKMCPLCIIKINLQVIR